MGKQGRLGRSFALLEANPVTQGKQELVTSGLVRRPRVSPRRDTGRPSGPARATLWAGGISASIAALCYSSFLLSPWTDASSAANGFISELEDPGQPFAWLYRTCDVVAGLGVLLAAWALWRLVGGRRWAAAGVALFVLTGVSSVLDAATSMQCNPDTSAQCAQHEHSALGLVSQLLALHTDSGLLGFIGSAAGAAVLGTALAGRWPRWGRLQIALGIAIASCGLADVVLLLMSGSIATTERARVLLTSGWFLVVGLFLATRAMGRISGLATLSCHGRKFVRRQGA